MKRICLAALTILLVCPASLLAKPVEVLVFPSGAIVTEQSSAAVADGAVTLSLPAVADPDSLKISTVDSIAAIGGLQFASVLETGGGLPGAEGSDRDRQGAAANPRGQAPGQGQNAQVVERTAGGEVSNRRRIPEIGRPGARQHRKAQ